MNLEGITPIPLSLGNRNWVKRVVYTLQPDVIIYAAGDPNVDHAEKNPQEVELTQTQAPGMVTAVSEIFQPKIIFMSSCHVYDGSKGNYREGDIVIPTNALGKAKVAGENFVRGKSINWTIVRSSPLYGFGAGYQPSFLDRLRRSLVRGERIDLPSNELHSFAPVQALVELVEKLIEGGGRNKILHYGGLTKLTYGEFARLFAKRFGYDPELITSEDAVEPFDLSLNSSVAADSLKIEPLLLEKGFDLIEKELISHA